MTHVYTVVGQPYTRWRIGTNILEKPSRWFTNSERRQDWCENCFRTRWAKNLKIAVYYDCNRITCAPKCEPSTYREREARRRKLARRQRG